MTASIADKPIVAGVPISHSDRLVYPELGITKLEPASMQASRPVGGGPRLVSRVPKRTYGSIPKWHDTAMPKPIVPVTARRSPGRARSADLPNAVEGQIVEICRDLAVQTKRVRQLQEQADELCTVIRQWAGGLEADWPRGSPSRGGRR